jgi:hypothetical protein
MTHEAPTGQERQEFDEICKQLGVAGRYEMFMKRNQTNWNSFRTVTIRDRKSGDYESYYTDDPPESQRYWLKRFSQALAKKTFGNRSEDEGF